MQEAVIRYSIVPCDLGWLLVGATGRGVCNVRFGDAPAPLEAEFRAEFPFAELRADPEGLAEWVGALRACLAAGSALEVPLDVRGSQFQRRVWDAIRAIPRGETRTYSEIAGALRRPRAARAVARACAANPIALAIPCHRVVPRSGGDGGYRWGAERKREILRREREIFRSERAASPRMARLRFRDARGRACLSSSPSRSPSS